VPVKTLRESMWREKTKWFAAAAAIMLLGSGMLLFRPLYDQSRMQSVPPAIVNDVISRARNYQQQFEAIQAASDVGAKATNMLQLVDYQRVWPFLVNDAASAIASTNPQPELLGGDVQAILQIDPKERRLVQLQKLEGQYLAPPAAKPAGVEMTADAPVNPGNTPGRRIAITLNVEVSHAVPAAFLNETVAAWLREHADPVGERANVPYRIIDSSVAVNPDRIETVAVSGSGEQRTAAQTPTAQQNTGSPSIGGFNAPRAGTASGGGSQGMRTTAGGGAGGAMRAPQSGQSGAAPGADIGTESRGAGGNASSTGPVPGARPTLPNLPSIGGSGMPGASSPDMGNLNEMAPAPAKPRLYPDGSQYFIVPITFEVELIDPGKKPAQPAAAAEGTST